MDYQLIPLDLEKTPLSPGVPTFTFNIDDALVVSIDPKEILDKSWMTELTEMFQIAFPEKTVVIVPSGTRFLRMEIEGNE